KGTATFRVDIDNAGLKTFQSTITKQLFQFLPDLVANVLAPTLGPIINDMLGKLLDLGSPRQTAELSVIYHDKGDPTSTPDPAQPTQPPDDGNAGDCPYGTWYVDDMADVVAAENAANGGSDVIFEDISGTSQVTFKTDGSYKWTWSDYVFKGLSIVPDVGSVEVKMTFNGTISGTFDLGESGLRIMSASNNLRIHGEAFLNGASIGEIPVDETAWVRSGQTMVISCGTGSESMTLKPDWLASSARYQLTKAK
ncbi:MAG TPA: hypothetical protein PK819_13050, partial [Thermomicrobiales bacterium]|nr:hypothetical protein [Thermomicrobiales bacterium]